MLERNPSRPRLRIIGNLFWIFSSNLFENFSLRVFSKLEFVRNLHKTSYLGPTGSIVAVLRFHNYSHLLLSVSGPASKCSLMTRSYLTTWALLDFT